MKKFNKLLRIAMEKKKKKETASLKYKEKAF